MLIVFITDLHTGNEGETALGIDLRLNFLDILDAVEQHPYDFLVIGGDLCIREGDREIYQWQKTHLDALDKPYYIIAGNHDDQEILNQVFPNLPGAKGQEIYYDLTIENQPLLFLDTARGFTSGTQKSWLRNRLLKYQNRQVIVFMHHPPKLMGVPHMDQKHALQDRDAILGIFRETTNQKHIFCGHYHVQKSTFVQQVAIHVTPSLFFQIDQFREDFAVDHRSIAYRIIQISDEEISTSLHFLAGNQHPETFQLFSGSRERNDNE